ncbi:MAG: DUF2029 domain-containing protein [Phycisphaerales bacterium]|nr:DUF2029 domain-containing protein [Phycisphaerales bacterium]
MALFLLTLAIGNLLLPANRSITNNMLGHDFLAFYTAGTFARQGQFDRLYDLNAARDFQHQLAIAEHLEIGQSFGPFWNPPFYAWVFAPLSALPYHAALTVWMVFNALCLATALFLLVRWLPADATLGTRLMVPLLVLVSMPCLQALNHAQNTCGSLLLVCLVVHFWRKHPRNDQSFWSDPSLWAGLICGLLFYKPQLGAILAAVLILTRGRRAFMGVAIAGTTLLLIPLLTMPGITADYLQRLPQNIHFMQVENTYLWERHVTLKSFWRLLLQGRSAGEALPLTTILTGISGLTLSGGLGLTLWRYLRNHSNQNNLQLDRIIAATIVTSPLLMPFYFDYDLLLLAIPATLLASENRSQRWLNINWVMLGVWMLFNSSVAGQFRVNLTVPLLASLAVMSIRRVFDQSQHLAEQSEPAILRPAA